MGGPSSLNRSISASTSSSTTFLTNVVASPSPRANFLTDAGPVPGAGAPDRVAGRGRALAYRSAPHHLESLAFDAAGQRLARNSLPRATRFVRRLGRTSR